MELLGAHVSTAGGVSKAPARGIKIGATAIQVFTNTPSQWREPRISADEIERFQLELSDSNIRVVVSHSSYLINLASPDPTQRARSIKAFGQELQRCHDLGIRFVVTHPGNFMDDRDAGIERNAAGYAECLEAVDGPVVLLETTAGAGTALGATFEELAELRHLVPPRLQERMGFCADTCHLYSAGYDLVGDWDGVWARWNEIIGLEHLRCLHLNDSKNPFGSRRDRHEWIAEGTLGPQPFRRVMRDPRFRGIIKVIETPKGDDAVRQDRRMLRRLRAYGRTTYKRRSG
ncbi:MAG: deoxyribonuclease IV [Gemmatimonadales bacterium]